MHKHDVFVLIDKGFYGSNVLPVIQPSKH